MAKVISAKLDVELYKKVKGRADRTGKSLSEYVKESLERAAVVRVDRESSKIACPVCAGLGIITEKDSYGTLVSHITNEHSGSSGGFIDQELLRLRIIETIGFVRQMEGQ